MTKMSRKLATMQRKQENLVEKLKAKAPNSIPYEDCWNLKNTLAGIIADHLRAFIYWEKHSPYGGCPGCIAQKYTDPERGMREWLSILRRMLYAFDSYRTSDGPEVVDDKEYPQQYDKERIREGMQLFIDYWEYLWI